MFRLIFLQIGKIRLIRLIAILKLIPLMLSCYHDNFRDVWHVKWGSYKIQYYKTIFAHPSPFDWRNNISRFSLYVIADLGHRAV